MIMHRRLHHPGMGDIWDIVSDVGDAVLDQLLGTLGDVIEGYLVAMAGTIATVGTLGQAEVGGLASVGTAAAIEATRRQLRAGMAAAAASRDAQQAARVFVASLGPASKVLA